jgi:S1-C subfamily serine protease
MDTSNYVAANLAKPMGIVFEENDSDFGGIFVLEINEGSSAAADGTIRPGDQLVSVGDKKVSGLQFEEALGTIINSKDSKVTLTFFRGPAKFLYGPAGASQDWLNDFIMGGAKVESA